MKGKIEVVFTVSNYGADPRVTTRAILRKKGVQAPAGSNIGALILAPYHEIKKYSTLQLILANHNMLDELDKIPQRGGNLRIVTTFPAEYIHAKRRSDDKEYNAVLVNFGTEEAPHVRIFYLGDSEDLLLSKGFTPQYTFDVQEDYGEELDPEEDSEEETE